MLLDILETLVPVRGRSLGGGRCPVGGGSSSTPRKEDDNGVRSGMPMRRFVHRASMLETSARRPDDPLFIRRRPCRGKVSPQLRLPSLSKRFEEYSPYYNLVLGDTWPPRHRPRTPAKAKKTTAATQGFHAFTLSYKPAQTWAPVLGIFAFCLAQTLEDGSNRGLADDH
ncbi:unnamed protein product [Darwinula stevensoni]|uniref:Uncharacterized protein n=1 Tax=Darwinula stevensoni TaxID=69355 RepID=A0A7R8XAU4_9CRUS|nr:unnamed protein product [Darwinula stevensoni]CAG0885813.1 unnamed protein product [Darwinula stevensoni]